VCLYRTRDCSPAVQCVWPPGPRQPTWTAYASIPTSASAGTGTGTGGVRAVMAADDGSLYVWEAIFKDAVAAGGGLGGCAHARCAGAVALPGRSTCVVVAMVRLPSAPAAAGPRLALLRSDGYALAPRREATVFIADD